MHHVAFIFNRNDHNRFKEMRWSPRRNQCGGRRVRSTILWKLEAVSLKFKPCADFEGSGRDRDSSSYKSTCIYKYASTSDGLCLWTLKGGKAIEICKPERVITLVRVRRIGLKHSTSTSSLWSVWNWSDKKLNKRVFSLIACSWCRLIPLRCWKICDLLFF